MAWLISQWIVSSPRAFYPFELTACAGPVGILCGDYAAVSDLVEGCQVRVEMGLAHVTL